MGFPIAYYFLYTVCFPLLNVLVMFKWVTEILIMLDTGVSWFELQAWMTRTTYWASAGSLEWLCHTVRKQSGHRERPLRRTGASGAKHPTRACI